VNVRLKAAARVPKVIVVPKVVPVGVLHKVLQSLLLEHTMPSAESKSSAVDWPKALEIVQDDCELLAEIAQTFLEEVPKLLQQLQVAFSEQDGKTFQRAAHTLKGSLRYFGASEAFNVAYELECVGREARFKDAPELLAKVEAELKHIEPDLRNFLDTGEFGGRGQGSEVRSQSPDPGPLTSDI